MSKCLYYTLSLFRHIALIIFWFPQDRREPSVHKPNGDRPLIQSLDCWYHRYWSFPWFRVCARALWSPRHVDCKSLHHLRATISRIVYATLPGVRDGGNRCVFLTLCCLRDDECMFLVISFFGQLLMGGDASSRLSLARSRTSQAASLTVPLVLLSDGTICNSEPRCFHSGIG